MLLLFKDEPKIARMINDLWYKNAIIYCLSVATYMDANGDGIGDFQGLMRRLDYLQGMGVTALWLMPFQPSPWRDGGYDITDYYGVDPAIRNIRRLRRIHPGLQAARDARAYRPGRKPHLERASLVSGGMPRSSIEVSRLVRLVKEEAEECRIRSCLSRSAEVHMGLREDAKAYYFHRFYDFQPDLNTSHPEVQAEILKIMGFWLQLGVAGFRMDAVPFVIAKKGAELAKPHEQYDMLRTFSEFLTWRKGGAIILGEANVLPRTDMEYFGKSGERMQMMFNFDVNQHLFYALASGDSRPLVKAMQATKPRPATAQWGQFLAQPR